MNDRTRESGALRRLRDFSGELRRPKAPLGVYGHLLRDDGRLDREEQMRIMALLLPPQNRKLVLRFCR
jgi:hypothetical protein